MIVKSEFIPLSKHFLLRAWVGIFLIEKVLVNNSQDSPLAYHRQFLFASLNNLRLKKISISPRAAIHHGKIDAIYFMSGTISVLI